MRWKPIITGLIVAALITGGLTYFFWNGRPRTADVTHAGFPPNQEANRIELFVSACQADLSAHIYETDEAVAVRVIKRYEWNGDCGGAIQVDLSKPLGDRLVIDLSDWKLVEVFR